MASKCVYREKIHFPTHTVHEDNITAPHLFLETNTLVLIPQYLYFYLRDRNMSTSNKLPSQALSRMASYTRCLMENKKKFAKENSKVQKAYEYFLKNNATIHYNSLMQNASPKEYIIYLQIFITHYEKYIAYPIYNIIQELSENRWYKFGQLSKKEKIKFLLTFGMKKILQKIKRILKKM